MRIISGSNKGKKLVMPGDKTTRPLRDMAKESIFNILAHAKFINFHLKDSKVLDLFSGIGSFGLECLSRGSKYVTFVENYNGVLPILKKNLSNLKLDNKYEIIEENLFVDFNYKKFFNKFDIIFLDPPYRESKINIIFDNLFKNKILNNDGIIIIHRHKKDNGEYSKNFKVLEEKKYGISKILFGTLN